MRATEVCGATFFSDLHGHGGPDSPAKGDVLSTTKLHIFVDHQKRNFPVTLSTILPCFSFFIRNDWKCEHSLIIRIDEYTSTVPWNLLSKSTLFFKGFSLLSVKHVRPVNNTGESINKRMKIVDISAWWLISPTDFRPVSSLPSPRIRPKKLSQALCVSDQFVKMRKQNLQFYAHLLGATFHCGPQGIQGFFHFPPVLSNMAVSVTLAHSGDSGRLLPRADIPYPLALACRQTA